MSAVNIKGTKNIVLYYLETEPHLRDSDEKLVANIWFNHLKSKNINSKEISGFDFLAILSKGDLPNSESIRRCRQELQSSLPELRGEKYKKRKDYQEDVKDDLDDFHNDLNGTKNV
jgi:hypothetical protein